MLKRPQVRVNRRGCTTQYVTITAGQQEYLVQISSFDQRIAVYNDTADDESRISSTDPRYPAIVRAALGALYGVDISV